MFKVLVVDDQKYERDIVFEFMKTIEKVERVDSADDGDRAIELMKSNNYDLVILDLVMQNKDGLELLRFTNLLEKKPKIVVVSAIGNSRIINKAFDYGIDYYFKKSFNFQYFRSVISNILLKKEAIEVTPYKIVEEVGIPSNLLGFRYINAMLKLMMDDDRLSVNQLYNIIANYYGTSSECVETNIRNTISRAHNLCNEAYVNIFNLSPRSKKPKNSTFLHTLLGCLLKNRGLI